MIQPAGTETQKRYAIPADLTVATFRFRWEPERIVYTTWSGNAPEPTPQTQLATWTFDRTSSSVDIPPTGDQQVHFNLWIKKARNLANIDTDPEEEVILNTFRYEPLRPGVLPVNVRNAAGYTGGAVSPGMLVSIFGYGLGSDISPTQWVQGDKAVTELAGTRVFFDNVPAPLTYAQWGQLNAIVPFAVRGRDTTQLVVEYAGVRSDPIQLPVLSTLPGIFSLYATGIGQGAILNLDGTVNGPGNPISRGSYATLYITGAGDYSPAVGDGLIIGNQNLPLLALPVKVTVGNVEARITYAGAAPGIVAGVAQINIQIPGNAPTGMDVPVMIQADNRPSQGAVSIAIQ